MGDIARALILPDLRDPSPETVRNLAIYWDEIVYPTYEDSLYLESEDLLLREGVVQPLERDVPVDTVFPVRDGFDPDKDWSYHFTRNADGEIQVELAPGRAGSKYVPELRDLSDAQLEAIAAIMLGRHIGFVDDSFSIAAENNLAPISHSLGGHLAAVIGSSQEDEETLPSREAALLSVVVEAFMIDPTVSSEEVLAFRDRHSQSQARLRGSLVDLASKLRDDASPKAMLAEARDTYKNRVEPALGDLEEALKESQVKFFLKSLVGATAIAIAPIEPVSTSAGAARVVGQTIDYSYSKSKLVREHPYGYLHEVGQHLSGGSSGPRAQKVATQMEEPRQSLARMWFEDWKEARELNRELAES
jgi:hypothetical protein